MDRRSQLVTLQDINLNVASRLEDKEFRKEWFKSELEFSVPNQFRALRETRMLTQNDLATSTSMKQSAISRFESSTDAKWKLETLLTIADALDARLTIELEPAELVLEKIRRQELKTNLRRASVLDQVSETNLNTNISLAQSIKPDSHTSKNLNIQSGIDRWN